MPNVVKYAGISEHTSVNARMVYMAAGRLTSNELASIPVENVRTLILALHHSSGTAYQFFCVCFSGGTGSMDVHSNSECRAHLAGWKNPCG